MCVWEASELRPRECFKPVALPYRREPEGTSHLQHSIDGDRFFLSRAHDKCSSSHTKATTVAIPANSAMSMYAMYASSRPDCSRRAAATVARAAGSSGR